MCIIIDSWAQVTPIGSIFQRCGHTSVYDTVSGLSYHIAGSSNGAASNPLTVFGDAWLFTAYLSKFFALR